MGRLTLFGFAVVYGSLLYVACTKTTEGEQPAEKLSPEEQKILEEYQAEVEIGRDMAGRLLAHYGTLGDQKVIGYVNQVGNYVASYGDYPDMRYMFAIIRSESINAFACPGGYVLVTVGALRAAQTEAELAAILGHEVAHVGKKHMFTTLKQMSQKELDENAEKSKQLVASSPALKMRKRPEPSETGAGAMLARYLSGSSGASLNILSAAKAGMNLILEKGLDKALEEEADREGVRYAIRAGYEPKALLNYLKRLSKAKGKTKQLGKTHPPINTRRKKIRTLLASLEANSIIGASGKKRFLRVKGQLPGPE